MQKIYALAFLALLAGQRLSAQCNPDTEPPVLEVTNGLTVNLGPICILTLWTTDLVASATDNCTPANAIELAIRKAGAGTGFPTDPDTGGPQPYVQFDACDLGFQWVELWGRDAAGNTTVDSAYLIVQDNMGSCDCFNLNALKCCAFTETGLPIDEIAWTLDGQHPALPPIAQFFMGPCLQTTGIPLGADLTITPLKDNDPLNGVSTFDLILINKHILNIERLNSPFKMIAADANNSRSVSTFDIIELRKLILGIYTEFPHNTSWRFIPKSYAFPDTLNPFAEVFPEVFTVTDLFALNLYQDFTGIKTGDVNGNAIAHSFAPVSEARSPISLTLEDILLKPGEKVQIPVRNEAELALLGLQFALAFDPELLEMIDVRMGPALLPDQFDADGDPWFAQPEPGLLTLSWDNPNPPALPVGTVLFTLEIKARQSLRLSDALHLRPKRLRPELYTAAGNIYDLGFHFSAPKSGDKTVIYPAAPNPFTGPVRVLLALEKAERVRLEVFDLNGRQVYALEDWLPGGVQQLEIPAEVLQGRVLWYRVSAGDATGNGKLVRGF